MNPGAVARFHAAQMRLLSETYDRSWRQGVESYEPDEDPETIAEQAEQALAEGDEEPPEEGQRLLAKQKRKYVAPTTPDENAKAEALGGASAGLGSMVGELLALGPSQDALDTSTALARSGGILPEEITKHAEERALQEWMNSNEWRLDQGESVAWSGEQRGYAEAAHADGQLIEWLTEADGRVCEDCEQLGSMPPMPLGDWPTTPGSGDTICNAGCRCVLQVADEQVGPEGELPELTDEQEKFLAEIAERREPSDWEAALPAAPPSTGPTTLPLDSYLAPLDPTQMNDAALAKMLAEREGAWLAGTAANKARGQADAIKRYREALDSSRSTDKLAHDLLANAVKTNVDNPVFQRVMRNNVPDLTVLTRKSMNVPTAPMLKLARQAGAARGVPGVFRVGGATFVEDKAVLDLAKATAALEPGHNAAVGDLAGELRRFYGESVEAKLTGDQRLEILKRLSDSGRLDPAHLLSERASDPQQAIAELFALVTDPRYRPAAWAPSVQQAGKLLLEKLGLGVDATAPVKQAAVAVVKAPAQINSMADATRFIRDTLGYQDTTIRLGKLLDNGSPESTQALRDIAEALRDARARLGDQATHLDGIWVDSEAAKAGLPNSPMADNVYAQVLTRPNEGGPGQTVELVINDSSMEKLTRHWLPGTTGDSGFNAVATRDLYGRMLHELGHTYMDNSPGSDRVIPKLLKEAGLNLHEGLVEHLSQYALQNTNETFAEVFATLMRPGGVEADLARGNSELDAKLKAALLDFRAKLNAAVERGDFTATALPTIKAAGPRIAQDKEHAEEYLGITPYRPEFKDSPRFYETQRYKGFEEDLHRVAAEEGVTVQKVERVRGVWKGGGEPAARVLLTDGVESVQHVADRMGSAYQQEGVIRFRENPEGLSVRVLSDERVSPQALERAMADSKLGGATLRSDGRVEVIDINGENEADVSKLERDLGIQFRYDHGDAELRLEGEHYIKGAPADLRKPKADQAGGQIEAGAKPPRVDRAIEGAVSPADRGIAPPTEVAPPGLRFTHTPQPEKTYTIKGTTTPASMQGHIDAVDASGKVVGRLDYVTHEPVPEIVNLPKAGKSASAIATRQPDALVSFIQVDPAARRQGVATELLNEARRLFPDHEWLLGYTTPAGMKWSKALGANRWAPLTRVSPKLAGPTGESTASIVKRLVAGEHVSIHHSQLLDVVHAAAQSKSPINLERLHVSDLPHGKLFDFHATELSRIQMPQIGDRTEVERFAAELRQRGIESHIETVSPLDLHATQNEIDPVKVDQIHKWISEEPQGAASQLLVVAKDGAVLDGHHRWAGESLWAIDHPDYRVGVLRVDAPIHELLKEGARFDREQHIAAQAFGAKAPVEQLSKVDRGVEAGTHLVVRTGIGKRALTPAGEKFWRSQGVRLNTLTPQARQVVMELEHPAREFEVQNYLRLARLEGFVPGTREHALRVMELARRDGHDGLVLDTSDAGKVVTTLDPDNVSTVQSAVQFYEPIPAEAEAQPATA